MPGCQRHPACLGAVRRPQDRDAASRRRRDPKRRSCRHHEECGPGSVCGARTPTGTGHGWHAGKCGRRDCQDRAPGMGQAVAAHRPQKAPVSVVRRPVPTTSRSPGPLAMMVRRRPGIAALDHEPDRQISGELPPGRVKRLPQPLPGVLGPHAAQVHARTTVAWPRGVKPAPHIWSSWCSQHRQRR